MDETLEGRLTELEFRAQRLILAGDERDQGGWGAWHNLLEQRLGQERDFLQSLLTELVIDLHQKFADIVAKAHADHVRGTFNPDLTYKSFDVVACNGGSFIARKDDPGPCPGGGWQMIAKQGMRGIAGEKGERGRDAPTIVKWEIDAVHYIVTPILDGGSKGPPIEFRPLLQQFLLENHL
jgi:hypothetical protein